MKNKKTSILAFMLVIFAFFGLGFEGAKGNVHVIPIEGEINRGTYKFVENSLAEIDYDTTEAVIFEIDTYGGLVDEAIKIKDLIIKVPVQTISYVNNKAVSAGVLLTIASDKVVMASAATIGSAETIPNTEKVLSMWRGVLRDTAQLNSRDPFLIEAMADRDIVIPNLIDKGKLLNLTSVEAKQLGLSDITADSYAEIVEVFNIKEANVNKVNESLSVKLTKYISSPYMATLLLTIGFVGLVIEVLTPGFGLGGTMSVIGFGLYFGGNILAGNSNWTSLILFITGIILMMIAVIVPGFGIPEIGGVLFMFGGVVLAVDSVWTALLSLSVAIIITTVIGVILIKLGFRSKILSKIVLQSNHTSERGYVSADTMDTYLDKVGETLTELRPTGFIEIEGERLDVLAEGAFISKDEKVKVVKVEGSTIFVRRI